MRVLVTTSPGLGHMFAPVPLAWAFRVVGHEVLIATSGRSPGDIAAIVGAGLDIVEIATLEQIETTRNALWARRQREAERLNLTMEAMIERDIETARRAKDVQDGNGFAFATRIFGPMSEATMDGLVRVAKTWKPDLVVYESSQGGGPLVAAMLGVPAVEHPIGFARGPELVDALREYLSRDYKRFGVRGLPEQMVALDISPPSMAVGPGYGHVMRYIPFNGASSLPKWLQEPRDRRRIAVTLGSVLPHGRAGLAPLRPLMAAAREVDAEFVLAVGDAPPDSLGELPPNVRRIDYVPLSALLRTCDAIVHHGGSATTLTTLDAGLPHLVLPQLADQFINAEAVRKRGCGIVAEDDSVDAAMVCRLLGDGGLKSAAAAVKVEMSRLPSPASFVEALTETNPRTFPVKFAAGTSKQLNRRGQGSPQRAEPATRPGPA